MASGKAQGLNRPQAGGGWGWCLPKKWFQDHLWTQLLYLCHRWFYIIVIYIFMYYIEFCAYTCSSCGMLFAWYSYKDIYYATRYNVYLFWIWGILYSPLVDAVMHNYIPTDSVSMVNRVPQNLTVDHHFSMLRIWLVVRNMTFIIFHSVGNNHPNWLIFFRGVGSTYHQPAMLIDVNSIYIYIHI